jgi:transglutaminase-like putative cysteine protease
MVVLGSVGLGLARTARNLESDYLLFVVFTGALVGWILGKSTLSGWISSLAAGAIGLTGFVIFFGNLGGLLVSLPIKMAGLYIGVWRWLFSLGQIPLDREPLAQNLASLSGRITTLYEHLSTWIGTLSSGEVALDPVISVLIWGMILWLTAAWAGWNIRRRYRVILGVTPAGAILVGSLNFVHEDALILVPFLGATFLLSVLVGHQSRENQWEKERIDYSTDIRSDLAIVSVLLVSVILLFATLVPSISLQRILEIGRRLSEKQPKQVENIGESLGLISKPDQEGLFGGIVPGGLPRTHLIGTGSELSGQVVMTIRTGELPPGPPDNFPLETIPRHYWRTLTYDQYTGNGWLSDNTTFTNYQAGELAHSLDFVIGMPSQHLINQEIKTERLMGSQIYATGSLITVDQSYQVAWRSFDPNFTSGRDRVEDFTSQDMFTARFNEQPGNQFTYHVQSLAPVIDQAQLRTAGKQYPTWIKERYLPLPGTITDRTTRLADELTASKTTPYEQAIAIESYLRQYPYSIDIPLPPAEQDVVDYFLFNIQRGYCDYYASAMVVLARLSGLPARLVVGYANGSYNTLTAKYIVTEADAHTWVEIYFQGIGWVEFEPTGSRPLIQYPEQVPVPKIIEPGMVGSMQSEPGSRWNPWLVGVTVLLIAVPLFFIGRVMIDSLRLHRASPTAAISNLYRRLRLRGETLVRGATPPIQKGVTPNEFAAGFSAHWAKLSRGPFSHRILSPATWEAEQIIQLYTKAVYSPRPPGPSDQLLALHTWTRLRWRLIAGTLLRRRIVKKHDRVFRLSTDQEL